MRGSVLTLIGFLAMLAQAPVAAQDAPASAQDPETRRWAVVVGINDYVEYPDVESGDLRGAVHDARSMKEVLVRRWGFPDENVRLLLDRDASRAGMEEALTGWLGDRVRPGDLAVFFFAGHGAQVLDQDGDEADGLDESIAPADVFPSTFEHDITDDLLDGWLDQIPGEVVVILDSCHSGTGTRLMTPQVRPRALPRELPEGAAGPGTRGDEAESGQVRNLTEREGLVELAGAAPDQVAMDAVFPATGTRGSSFAGGAFTTHLVRQLWRVAPGTSYQEVFRATVEAMKADRFTQDPQLHGDPQARLFGLDAGSASELAVGEVAVVGSRGDSLVISAGASLGVTAGSLYEARDGTFLRILRVESDRALAVPLSGSPDRVGGVVSLVAAALPEVELRVDARAVDTDTRQALARGLESQPRVSLGDGEGADLFLDVEESSDTLTLRSRDGGVRGILDGSGPPDEVADRVVGALRQELAAQRLVRMDNPVEPFAVELELPGDTAQFEVGDPIAFRVRSERSGYLTLVDLGTDGTITVLYPNRLASSSRIRAGEWLEIPTTEMGFRFRAAEPAGWGMVRALVTEEPLEIPLGEEPLRQEKRGELLAAEVLELVRTGLAGSWDRSADLDGAVPLDSWNTTIVNYRIR